MSEQIKEIMDEVTERIQKNATVKAVFGEPVVEGNITVIPVARVSIKGMGCGCMGDDEENHEIYHEKHGMGMGIRATSVPVGYIEITPSGTHFVEIIEKKRMIFFGIGLGVFALFSLYRKLNKMLND